MKLLKIGAVWCPGCLVMQPRLKKIKEAYQDIEYIDYDYDIDENIIEKYQIGDILPVFIMQDNNNNELGRLIGEQSIQDLEEFIKKCKG